VTDAQERQASWGIGDVGIGLAVVLLAEIVGVSLLIAVLGIDTTDIDQLPLWQTAVLQVPLWLGLLGVPWWASRTKGTGSLDRDFGLRARWVDVPVGVLGGLVGQVVVVGLVLAPLTKALGIHNGGETAQELVDRAHDVVGVVLLVLIVVIGAALFEELFYRGLVLRAIQRRYGDRVAIAGSSLLFAVMHFQPADTIALTGTGVVFAVLAVRSGRLGPSICAHMAFNALAVISLLSS
jgi:membrane protease YdiL (CAAX protease family)